jgi:hypothetical protein
MLTAAQVVDMLNPEFFLGAFKAAASGDAWRPAALYTGARGVLRRGVCAVP